MGSRLTGGKSMDLRAKLLVAIAGGTMLLAGPAAASHQWASYHWSNNGTGVSLTVKHAFRVSGDWSGWYGEAIADWEGSTSPLNLTDGGGYTGTTSKKCDPIAGQILVCSDLYGFRGWLGIATIWANGDHITQGTTKLNDSYYSSGTYNTPAWRDIVMCQEIGHDFGLDHQDETFDNPNLGTCMDYTNEPGGGGSYGLPNLQPNSHDYEMLNSDSMYGSNHRDSGGGGGGTCNPRSPKCGSGQTDAFTFREVGKPAPSAGSGIFSAEWGHAIEFDGQGRPDTFLLDLGNGRAKITHVFWVPGHRPTAEDMH